MSNLILNNSLIDLHNMKYSLTHSKVFFDFKNKNDNSHIHNCIEIYLNISGNVSFLVKNSIYPINTGDIILTRRSEVHRCIYHNSGVHEHFCLWLSQEYVDKVLSFINTSNINHIVFEPENKKEVIDLFYQLDKMNKDEDLLASSACILRILTMIRKYLEDGPKSIVRGTLPKDFQDILDYININYGELKNVRELTDVFFISLSTLNRRFTEYLHITPKAYLDSVKLSNAKRLLMEGKSVTRVCNDCGYSDSSHFIRSFKNKFNITPHKFKKST